MTTVAIHQPQFLPYLGFFHKVASCDLFVVLDEVQFQWRGVQHRNRIKTDKGARWLTVPVLHGSHQRTNEVEIDPTEPWQRRQMNALRASYARAPFYREYAPELHRILERSWSRIAELDDALTAWVMHAASITTPTVRQSELGVDGHSSELLAGICNAVGADRYLSGPGGRRYMDLGIFEDAGVTVVWQEFTPPRYEQMFPEAGFLPDLSVVDALFSCGPDVKGFLG